MNAARLWTVARLELTQRVRTVSWYVLVGVFALLLIGTTLLAFLSFSGQDESGPGVFSTVVNITLLLVLLVSPTLSGNSINGDRDAATLAPLQVTQATTADILLGKFLAAWLTGLVFALVAVPFLVIASFAGGVRPATVIVSLVVLVLETGVVAAIGVALSGILARPLFSVATTYLVVAALAVGTPIVFGLTGTAFTSEGTYSYRWAEYDERTGQMICTDGSAECYERPELMVCGDWETDSWSVPRFDRVWWLLAPNPFVVLADATPVEYRRGEPVDLFGYLKVGVRMTQQTPELETRYDECDPEESVPRSSEEIVASTAPSWFVGLALQVALAGALLWRAGVRTRTPARTLPPGTRIA